MPLKNLLLTFLIMESWHLSLSNFLIHTHALSHLHTCAVLFCLHHSSFAGAVLCGVHSLKLSRSHFSLPSLQRYSFSHSDSVCIHFRERVSRGNVNTSLGKTHVPWQSGFCNTVYKSSRSIITFFSYPPPHSERITHLF